MTKKILVVCYGNRCRSPMFEALLRRELRIAGMDITVESAGMMEQSGLSASEYAQQCMHERGLDLSEHVSRRAVDVRVEAFDRVYVVEDRFITPLVGLGARSVMLLNREGGGIPNPWEQGIDAYRACARLLQVLAIQTVNDLAVG